MHVSINVCVHVSIYVCVHVSMCVCMCLSMCVCMCLSMCVCEHRATTRREQICEGMAGIRAKGPCHELKTTTNSKQPRTQKAVDTHRRLHIDTFLWTKEIMTPTHSYELTATNSHLGTRYCALTACRTERAHVRARERERERERESGERERAARCRRRRLA